MPFFGGVVVAVLGIPGPSCGFGSGWAITGAAMPGASAFDVGFRADSALEAASSVRADDFAACAEVPAVADVPCCCAGVSGFRAVRARPQFGTGGFMNWTVKCIPFGAPSCCCMRSWIACSAATLRFHSGIREQSPAAIRAFKTRSRAPNALIRAKASCVHWAWAAPLNMKRAVTAIGNLRMARLGCRRSRRQG